MNFLATLLEQYTLLESLHSVIKSNPHIPEQTIRDYHANALPDGNKSDKLLNHVLKLHNNGEITPARAAELKPHLTALHLADQLNKISSLKTLDDHRNATIGLSSNTKKERIDKDTPVLLNTPNILVKQHLTHESAIRGAKMHPENPMYNETSEKGKSQWCVSLGGASGLGYFNRYTESGIHPMYTVFNKGTKRVTAIVARPSDTYTNNEIRNEQDSLLSPYKLLMDNPGIIHTPIIGHINAKMPKVHSIIKDLPFNANKKQIVSAVSNSDNDYRNAAMEHDLNPHLNEIVKHKTAILHLLTNSYKLPPNHITTILDHNDDDINKAALRSGNDMDSTHIDKLLTGSSEIKKHLIRSKGSIFEPRHIETLLNDKDPDVRSELSEMIPATYYERLSKDPIPSVRASIARSYKLKGPLVNALVNDKDPTVRQAMSKCPNLEEHHVTSLVNDTDPTVRRAIASTRVINYGHIQTLMANGTPEVTRALTSNRHINPEYMYPLLYVDDAETVQNMAAHPNLNHRVVDDIIMHSEHRNRNHILGVARNPSLMNLQRENLLRKDAEVRAVMAKHGNLNLDQLNHLSKNDPDENVRKLAKMSLMHDNYIDIEAD